MGSIAILINGQALDLPVDFSVEREAETSLFNRELNRKDFTYPVTLPLTEKNNTILGLADNLAVQEKPSAHTADMYLDGTYYNQVTLQLLTVSRVNSTVDVSIIGTYGTFARYIGDKKLSQLNLDGDRSIGTTSGSPTLLGEFIWLYPSFSEPEIHFSFSTYLSNAIIHMKEVATGAIETDYLFYSAVDTKQNITGLNEECSNLINMWDWAEEEFMDPIIEYYREAIREQSPAPYRHFIVPFFKVLYVIRKCFEENGFKVTGNIFTQPDKQMASLYNTATICHYQLNTNLPPIGVPANPAITYETHIHCDFNTIHPQDHMPDMTVLQFLNEIAKAWNLKYNIDLKLMTVEVVQLKNFVNTAIIIDLSQKTSPEYEIDLGNNELEDGYKLIFSQDPANSYTSDKQKDELGDHPVKGAFDTLEDLTGTDPELYSAFDLAYIRSENAWYQFGGSDWFFYSLNFFPVMQKPGAENPIELETKCVGLPNGKLPVCRTFDTGSDIELDIRTMLLPVSNIGIKGKDLLCLIHPERFRSDMFKQEAVCALKNSEEINIQPHITYYRGFHPNTDLIQMPYASVHTVGPTGTAAGGDHFFWDSPDHDGLYTIQWEDWLELLQSSFPVKWLVLLDSISQDTTDLENKIVRIHGQNYLLKKENTPLPFPTVASMEFVRI